AFSIIYAIMNVGYLVAGVVFDFIRRSDFHPSFFGFAPTTHQQLFMVSLALEIVLFPTIYFLRRRQGGERQVHSTMVATVRASARETIDLFNRLLGQSAFFRLLVFF